MKKIILLLAIIAITASMASADDEKFDKANKYCMTSTGMTFAMTKAYSDGIKIKNMKKLVIGLDATDYDKRVYSIIEALFLRATDELIRALAREVKNDEEGSKKVFYHNCMDNRLKLKEAW